MAYNSSKGPQQHGDIKFEGDPLETQIDFENDFIALKKMTFKKNVEIPKRFYDFKKLLNSDNFNRFKCIFLPIDAVLKALKL